MTDERIVAQENGPLRPDPAPETSHALEMASLPKRHPEIGEALLKQFGAQIIIRLAVDPMRLPSGSLRRSVTINRCCPELPGGVAQEKREICWVGVQGCSERYLVQVRGALNQHRITEDAAIGVMALLIHELEGVTVRGVLQIGSGGDYLIDLRKKGAPVQVEVSGIRDDTDGRSVGRLRMKCSQILKKSNKGYVSVTAFRWPQNDTALSYLHFVDEGLRAPGGRNKTGKKRKRR